MMLRHALNAGAAFAVIGGLVFVANLLVADGGLEMAARKGALAGAIGGALMAVYLPLRQRIKDTIGKPR